MFQDRPTGDFAGERAEERTSGFTLVELVIIMAVISLILSAVMPYMRGMQEEGGLTQAEHELQTLRTAVISYWKNNDSYPSDIGATLVAASPQILTEEVRDPWKTNADGVTYGYTKATDPSFGDYFILWTQGPKHDTTPSFSSGSVSYTGSGRVVSNAPVVKH